MSYPISIPLKLLHESKGHVVSIEIKTGDVYRGQLMHVEDTMNCLLENVKLTTHEGQLHSMDQAYIKGTQVRWVSVPEALKHAPFLKQKAVPAMPGKQPKATGPRRASAAPKQQRKEEYVQRKP